MKYRFPKKLQYNTQKIIKRMELKRQNSNAVFLFHALNKLFSFLLIQLIEIYNETRVELACWWVGIKIIFLTLQF